MLRYEPGDSLAHGLDPRSKLVFQFGFAAAVFAAPSNLALAGLGSLSLACLFAARLSLLAVLRAYWVVLVILGLGPVVAGLTLGDPWFRLDPALASLRAVARLPPILLVSAAYVHSTPVRDTRAAIQRHVPGRFGQLLGVGVGLTVRFIPLVRADLGRIRDALRARGGETRSRRFRMGRIATLAVARSLDRAGRLATALQARCFAWNPTLPALTFSTRDYPVVGLGVALLATPLLGVL
jgi:biotin transport system permease protein